ncbi:MAG TPA: LEA type 2 family protein [Gemmatimonadaceae bacterium]|nr:LEA type 2 family protein [Gemmatimonadaceae bacterium]
MKRMLMLSVAAGAVALGAGACSSLGRQMFKQPVVNLQDVKVTGLGLNGGSLDVILGVQNPNDFRLDARRLTYRVLMDTVTLATGATDQPFTVDSKNTQQVHIPINFTYAGLGQAGRSILNNGTVNYTVSGDVTVGSPVGNFTIPFSQTGRYSTLGGSSR